MPKVNLEEVADHLELICDSGISFINKTTMQLFHLSKEELEFAKQKTELDKSISGWQRENIMMAAEIISTDNYIRLPVSEEINECGLMMKFCLTNTNEQIKNKVRFLLKDECDTHILLKDIISKFNIGEAWYRYKRAAFRHIAIDWCKRNKIEIL